MPGFIDLLYRNCEGGLLELRAIDGAGKKPPIAQAFSFSDIRGRHEFIKKHMSRNLYFAVSTRDGKGGSKENIVHVPAVWCDIDFKETPEDEAWKLVKQFPLEPTLMIHSGGGLHIYWVLIEPGTTKEIVQLEETMRGIAQVLKADIKCAEIARILRIPGTINHKYNPPKEVKLIHEKERFYSLDDFDFLPTVNEEADTPTDFSAGTNTEKINRIMQCKFMQHCQEAAASLSEPQWYAMMSELCHTPGGVAYIHRLSRPYPGYSKDATDKKILHAIDAASPTTCLKIKDFFKCDTDCGVKAPASLAFLESWNDGAMSKMSSDEQNEQNENSEQKSAEMSRNEQCSSLAHQQVETQFSKNIKAHVHNFIMESTGYFYTQDLDRELNLRTRQEKNARSQALYIELKKKYIIKDKNIRSKYYILEDQVPWIDPTKQDTSNFKIELPLNLNEIINIPPKAIIVVAGTTNAGKTALLLNIAALNMESEKTVTYQMSEMSGAEYTQRIELMNHVPLWKWKNIKALERSSGFNTIISRHNPNGINLVDFLEETEGKYFEMTARIREIYDSLGEGIAVIAIQKKSTAEYGRGGEGTAEKARLYIAVDCIARCEGFDVCCAKIIKAKSYPHGTNPNGKETHFKLYYGARIEPITPWQWVEPKFRTSMIEKYKTRWGERTKSTPSWYSGVMN